MEDKKLNYGFKSGGHLKLRRLGLSYVEQHALMDTSGRNNRGDNDTGLASSTTGIFDVYLTIQVICIRAICMKSTTKSGRKVKHPAFWR